MITVKLAGGLGQQLFQICCVLAYSLRYKCPLMLPKVEKTLDKYGKVRNAYFRTFLKSLKNYNNFTFNTNVMYNEPKYEYIEIPNYYGVTSSRSRSRTITVRCLNGYFQSYKYFEDQFKEIAKQVRLDYYMNKMRAKYMNKINKRMHRYMINEESTEFNDSDGSDSEFEFEEDVEIDTSIFDDDDTSEPSLAEDETTQTETLTNSIMIKDSEQTTDQKINKRLEDHITVSIHFRYVDFKPHTDEFILLKLNYYDQAISRIIEETGAKTITFLYFCDKDDNKIAQECIYRLKLKYNRKCGKTHKIKFMKCPDIIKDWEQMMIMACCHHNIIANSTFSWWGGYINPNPTKIVISPSRWFTKESGKSTTDVIPEQWVKIGV
jgi:hypothetical protein